MTSQQSLALSMRDLMSDGVRADVLQALLPRAQGASEESETSTELVPLNQVITRGEDVTGESLYYSQHSNDGDNPGHHGHHSTDILQVACCAC